MENYNRKKIIEVYSAITGRTSVKKIENVLHKSSIYKEILQGNEVYLYEGYTANILEIVEELKKQENCPNEVYLITPQSVVEYNLGIRDKRKKEIYEDDTPLVIPKKYKDMTLEELEIEMLEWEEMYELLRYLPGAFPDLIFTIITFTEMYKYCREKVVKYIKDNKNSSAEDVLKYLIQLDLFK